MKILQKLTNVLEYYLRDVTNHIESRRNPSRLTSAALKVAVLPEAAGSWFAECETLRSWQALLMVWDEVLSETDWVVSRFARTADIASALGHWLRRRGPYAAILSGKQTDSRKLAKQLLGDSKVWACQDRFTEVFLVGAETWDSEDYVGGSARTLDTALMLPKGFFKSDSLKLLSQPSLTKLRTLFGKELDYTHYLYPRSMKLDELVSRFGNTFSVSDAAFGLHPNLPAFISRVG